MESTGIKLLEVNLGGESYSIHIERNCLELIGRYIAENHPGSRIAIITDDNVNRLYGGRFSRSLEEQGLEASVISVKPGEESKSLDTLKDVYGKLAELKLTRQDLILAFGGGVVGDLSGFAAATYLRGVPYIQIPTSLLAQVDSSVGGKVAVDLPWGKNLVGNFYQPKAVFIDPELLKTLDSKNIRDGLSEIIKYGCIRDENILDELMRFSGDEELLNNIDTIIYRCCSIKKSLVEKDEMDFGDRMLLNFGHTLGHAVEKYFGYKRYTHGEAVALGMAHITRNSAKLGVTENGALEYLEELLERFQLPSLTPQMEMTSVEDIIKLDKKNTGDGISLVMIRKMGQGFIKKIKLDDLGKYINVEGVI
jgi:3-dehydroquinate synthase